MKKFLQIFALCALCVLAAPMVFAQNYENIITVTNDDAITAIREIRKTKDREWTVEVVGEIDSHGLNEIAEGIFNLSEKTTKQINLDMSKTFGLKEIPSEEFLYCNCLKSIVIPSSVEYIGNDVFMNCTNLKQIIVDENNEYYKSLDGVLYNKDESILIRYPSYKEGKSFVLPDTVKYIEDGAFYACTNLAEIIVDEKNESYKAVDGVLYNKDGTLLICYPPDKPGKSFAVPNGVRSISAGAFARNRRLESVIIPDGVKYIEDWTFAECALLESMIISNSVESIGNFAFRFCMALKSITMSDNIETIGNYAFYSCTNLKNIILPANLKSTGSNMFFWCIRLKSVTMPDSVEKIGFGTFQSCKKLRTINYKGSKEQWNAIDKEQYWNEGCPLTMKINFNYQE